MSGTGSATVAGGHAVIASYSGDANFQSSSSSPLSKLTVSNAASFNLICRRVSRLMKWLP
ncbi:MAG TPA: Ig-like domain-containing protein [Candidatus Sulfopaludibacter sp.]|nr:Ig-like domain-containing protein [Candidatus Sulfopaludibacter sp.]